MKNYRIVEERTTITHCSTFLIEVEKRFLLWKWWVPAEKYNECEWGYTVTDTYKTLEKAQHALDLLKDETKKIIHTPKSKRNNKI